MDLITNIKWLIEVAMRNMDRPYSLARAAEYLQVSKSFLYKMVREKKIPHSRINNKLIYFTKKDLDEFALGKRKVK